MHLSDAGRIAVSAWEEIRSHFRQAALDVFIVMPDHVHGIIAIVPDGAPADARTSLMGATSRATHASPLPSSGSRSQPLGVIIGSFKSAVTKRVNEQRGTRGAPVWQRNYHDHVIRHADVLQRLRKYIVDNPARWNVGATHASPET